MCVDEGSGFISFPNDAYLTKSRSRYVQCVDKLLGLRVYA